MIINEIERNTSNYKKIKTEQDIENIIEKPLIEPIKELFKKRIITIMSSANQTNIVGNQGNTVYDQLFTYGNGYAYIILDYDSLSIENKKKLVELYEQLNGNTESKREYNIPISPEDTYKGNKRIIFAIHQTEKIGQIGEIDSTETYKNLLTEPDNIIDKEFFKRSDFVYTTPYTDKSIILRYPVTNETTEEEIASYFKDICSTLEPQEKYFSLSEIADQLRITKNYFSNIQEIVRTIS